MTGFDPVAFIEKETKNDSSPSESFDPVAFIEKETGETIAQTNDTTISDNIQEVVLPDQKKHSGKNLDIISNITVDNFRNNFIFEKPENRETYFQTLYKKGYTVDDVNTIRSNTETALNTKPLSITVEPNANSPEIITTGKSSQYSPMPIEIGGKKENKVLDATIELFKNDPTFFHDQEKQKAYYDELNRSGINTNDVFKNNVRDIVRASYIEEGKGFYTLLNPLAQTIKVSGEMIGEGDKYLNKAAEKLKKDDLKSLGEAGIFAVKGVVDKAMGAITMTPAGMAFVNAIEVAHTISPGITDAVMTPVTTVSREIFGYEPKSEAGKALFSLFDFAGFAVGLKAGHGAASFHTAKGKQAIKDIVDPTGKANTDMKIKELADQFGSLTPEQKRNASELWADMKMNELNNQDIPYRPKKLNVKQSDFLDNNIPPPSQTPQQDAKKVVEVVNENIKKQKEEFEQVKKEIVPDSESGLMDAIPTPFPKLYDYLEDFDKTQPINEVASGLSVKYKGRNGQTGRSETGEITFTDYNTGKTEILTGGGDITPFSEYGLKVNEGTVKVGDKEFYVQGDKLGYTVYEIKDNKLKIRYEGDKINQSRKDAIVRKALKITEVESEYEAIKDKIDQLQSDAEKGGLLGNIVKQKLEEIKLEEAKLSEKIQEEAINTAMEYAHLSEAKRQISELEASKESVSVEGKKIIEEEIEKRESAISELKRNDEIPQEVNSEQQVEIDVENNGKITSEQVRKFENLTEEQRSGIESTITDTESKARSSNKIELNDAIKKADELIESTTSAGAEAEVKQKQNGKKGNQKDNQEGLLTEKKQEKSDAALDEQPAASDISKKQSIRDKIKEAKKKADENRDISKLGAFSDPFEKAKKQAKLDREVHDLYVDLAKEYINDGIKTVAEFAKEIGEEINEIIIKAWDEANGKLVVGDEALKSMATRAVYSSEFESAVKKKIESHGLMYEIRRQEDAAKSADKFISEVGVDEALYRASNMGNNMYGDNRQMVIARAIDTYYNLGKDAKTPEEKAFYNEKQADALVILDEMVRTAGQLISSVNYFYKTSPVAFEIYIKRQESKHAESELNKKPTGGTSNKERIEKGKKALTTGSKDAAAKETGEFATDMQKKSNLSPEKTARKEELKKKFSGFFNESTNVIKLVADKEFREYGKLIIEEGATDFKAFSKRAIKELGEKVKPILKKWYQAVGGQEDVTGLTKKFEKALAEGNKAAADKAIKDLQNISKDEGLWGQYADEAARKLKAKAVDGLLSDAKSSPPLQAFVDGLVKNMLQKIKESLPEAERLKAEKRPAIEIIGDAIKNKEKYNDVWDKTQAELRGKLKDNPEALNKLDEYFGEIMDKPFSEKLLTDAIKDTAKKEKIDIGKLAEEHFKAEEQASEKLVQKLIDEAGLSEAEATQLAKVLQKKFNELVTEKRNKVLEKMFPPTVLQRSPIGKSKYEKANEKIIKTINSGVFDNPNFEKLFYEKLGILDVNNPEISAKLKMFAEKLYDNKNKDNTIFYDRIYQDMLDYLQDAKTELQIKEGIINQMYAHMLYGPDTHLRNTSYNAQATVGSVLGLAVRNRKYGKEIIKQFLDDLYRGKLEAGEIMMHGYNKSNEPATVSRSINERSKTLWGKHVRIPFRLLSAMDASMNFPTRGAKTYEIFVDEAIKRNKELPVKERLSTHEIIEHVNELMGKGNESKLIASAEAAKQIKDYYGISDLFINGQRNPKYNDPKYNRIYRDYERSVYNLIESKRDREIVLEAKEWADNTLLMGRPKGYFGVAADAINSLGREMPILKLFTTPFVNVPLNIAAHLYEYSPLGYVNVISGKERNVAVGKRLGETHEISERRRRDLAIKATTGTIGMMAVSSLGQLEYYDKKEKKKRPIMIVFGDGTGKYYENKKLENLTGSDKFEEYTVDIMGKRFSYKYSPYAAFFIAEGARQDRERYNLKLSEKDKISLANQIAYSSFKYMIFMKDQAAVSGLMDILDIADKTGVWDDKKPMDEKALDHISMIGAKAIRNMLIPNYIPTAMREYKGLMDDPETGGRGFVQRLAKDIPFADSFSGQSEDHFGDKITQRFILPSIYKEERVDNPLYQMAKDHDYIDKLRFYTDRDIYINGQYQWLSKETVDKINKKRNKLAGDEIKLRYNALNLLDNDSFKEEMNDIYLRSEKQAKNEVLGLSWSNIDKYSKPSVSNIDIPDDIEVNEEFEIESPE